VRTDASYVPLSPVSFLRRARRQMIRDAVVDGISAGTFREVDPDTATLAIFGMCNWAAVRS
jgi:hypothetical protein